MSGYGSPLSLVYTERGGSAYVAGNAGGIETVIAGDGHGDGVGAGMYGAEAIIGAAHGAGIGSYLVVQPSGEQYGNDLVINGADAGIDAVSLALPSLDSFLGPVMLGGSAAPPFPIGGAGAAPLPLSVPGAGVRARRLVIAGEVELAGPLVVMGSAVVLQANLSTGGSGLVIVATGGASAAQPDGDGFVTSVLASGEGRRNISAGSALMVAARTFSNADSVVVALGAGQLQYAQGFSESVPTFADGSSFIGVAFGAGEYLRALGLGNINTGLALLSGHNPASALLQLAPLSPDMALSGQPAGLLFGLVGNGVFLPPSLCGSLEGCAPPLELGTIGAAQGEAG